MLQQQDFITIKNDLEAFVNQYHEGFLTEDQLRFAFIKHLYLADGPDAQIERPYVMNKDGTNDGILKQRGLLKQDIRRPIALDLFYNKDNENSYMEFKCHLPTSSKDSTNTMFSEVMNDLHRLSYLAKEHDNHHNHYYFGYILNDYMVDRLNDWKNKYFNCGITDLFTDKTSSVYSAINYVAHYYKWGQGTKEFKNKSFSSFDTTLDGLPLDNGGYLKDIKYEQKCFETIGEGLYFVVIEVKK